MQAPPSAEYEMQITIDPARRILSGEARFHFRYLEFAEGGAPLALDPAFRVTESGLGESGLSRTGRMDPDFRVRWEGWPLSVSPEGSRFTHISQDHLLFDPFFLWYPAVVDTSITAWGKVSISHPENFQLVTDGTLLAKDRKFGFRKSTYSFGGLNDRPRVLILSRYRAREDSCGSTRIRCVLNPAHQEAQDRILRLVRKTLPEIERLCGPYRFPELTVVEAPQVLRAGYSLGHEYLGLGFKGLILIPSSEIEGTLDEGLLCHEIAHEWWGALVGKNMQKRSGGLWIVEAMAEYASLQYKATVFGPEEKRRELAEWARQTRWVIDKYGDEALARLGTDTSPPERLALVYSKGPYVVEMMAARIGHEHFATVVQTLVKEWEGTRPTVDDFERDLGKITGERWKPFFDAWVRQPGLPRIAVRYAAERNRDGSWALLVQCDQEEPFFDVRLPIRVIAGSRQMDLAVELRGARGRATADLPEEPTALFVNPDYEVLLGAMEVARVSAVELDSPTRR